MLGHLNSHAFVVTDDAFYLNLPKEDGKRGDQMFSFIYRTDEVGDSDITIHLDHVKFHVQNQVFIRMS